MQLEFLWGDRSSLEKQLTVITRETIHVVLTDNSSTIMTYKSSTKDSSARLRIHRMFLSADANVVAALAQWVSKRQSKRASRVLDAFIRANEHRIQSRPPRPPRIVTKGMHFDLNELFDRVNEKYFDNTVDAPITWGKMPRARRRNSIRLGSYTPEDHLIRIHPFLDQSFVPRYFVRYIVFHEMLHAHLGVDESPSGRQRIHTSEFNRLEHAYPDYRRAVAWHDNPKNLGKLLRAVPIAR